MVITPKKWNKNKEGGGYLNKEFKNFANISLLHKSYKISSISELRDIQIDTIKFLIEQIFKINKEML